MKTLLPGRKQKGWSTETTCTGNGNGNGGCGAKLLVEQTDLYITRSYCRDECDTFATFTCHECGMETDLRRMPPVQIQSKESWQRRRKAVGD